MTSEEVPVDQPDRPKISVRSPRSLWLGRDGEGAAVNANHRPAEGISQAMSASVTYERIESCAWTNDRPVSTSVPTDGAPFDLGAVLAQGQLLAGAPDSMGPCFVSAYERLTASLAEESHLTPLGTEMAHRRLITSMANQLAVRQLVESGALGSQFYGDNAVFVTGLPFSGVSRLQRLLNEHPLFNIPSIWEQIRPVSNGVVINVKEELDRVVDLFPGHSGLGFGDHLLLTYAFHSPGAALEYRVPDYSKWLWSHDSTTAYAFHRFALAVILERIGGGTPVLASPFHAWHLDGLIAGYPTARVIRLHGDPMRSLAALSALTVARRRAWSEVVRPRDVMFEWASQLGAVLLAEGWRAAFPEGVQVLDLDYADLMETPLLVVRRVCRFLEVPLPAGIERRILQACEDAGAGSPPAWISDFGVSIADLPEVFREGVEVERRGRAQVHD
ncbi:sulfotransferase [Sphaerimonospora cavernae]|uniref:Sulfotransferase n=1 Tax=Sphaerimonospora cavernae TaxID=1740611 RepID=A0ABV6UCJ1_9ACTN